FGGGGVGPLVAGAAVPAIVAIVAAAGYRALLLRLAVDAAGTLLIIGLLPAASDGRSALAGLAGGPARLITSAVPLQAAGPELATVVVVVAACSAATVEMALRSSRRLVLLAPAVLLLTAALLAGAGGQQPPTWDAALVTGMAGVLVVRRGNRRLDADAGAPTAGPTVAGAPGAPSVAPVGRLVAGYATVAVLAAVLVPLGGRLPGDHTRRPYDLLAALSPPAQPAGQVDPLTSYAYTYDGPPQEAFTSRVTGTGNPQALFWRLTTLDGFDEFQWSSTAVYRRAGTKLPAGPAVTAGVVQVRADVRLAPPSAHLPSGYLPAPSRPTQVSIGGLDVSGTDAVLALPAGRRLPPTYQVTSAVPSPSTDQLLSATIPAGTGPTGPPIPPSISGLAASVIAAAQPTPFARLKKLRDYLTGPPFSRQPPGHSPIGSGYDLINQLLNVTHVGSAEQYAAAFAIMARSVGFRTRLAVGYYGGRREGTTVTYTTRDYDVWPEVYLNGIGWYPLPVNPAAGDRQSTPAPDSLSQAIRQQQQPSSGPPAKGPPTAPVRPPHRSAGGGAVPIIVLAVIGILGALLCAAAVVVGVKASFRRRRRRGLDPAQRIAGAWEHVVDCLNEFGLRGTPALTVTEVAEGASRHLGREPLAQVRWMVPVVDATRYDRRFPPSTLLADAVWSAALQAEKAIRRQAGWWTRARARLSLAPLHRRR
ncbi:MAG: DUF3488 and transglutaminase-like domain-containing protein, partial [Actinomycetota bacterium]|nr:DUF3488 and transglutaminase-like domain-containing protein [Actinomycetota bacterium]